MDALLQKLITRLRESLPGEEVQFRMAPVSRARFSTLSAPQDYKASAVMILLCLDESGELFIPLIERVTYDGVHSGQVSFPGGRRDTGDKTLADTALRECFEEIGIGKGILIAGSLSQLHIPVSGYIVEPVVGVYKHLVPVFIPNKREVQNIIRLKVSMLMQEDIVKVGEVNAGGMSIQTPYYEVEGYRVWGATAMMLSELKEILKAIF